MDGPRVEENDFTERYGVLAVARAVLDARCIWRETLLRDVGIDDQIEHRLESGVVSGRLVTRDLARVDFDAWRRMSERFGMVGHFIAPLTVVGEELVAYLHEHHADLVHAGLTRERFITLDMRDIDERIPLQLELARRLGSES